MSSPQAFISFEDALRMQEYQRHGWGDLADVFLFDGIGIENDFTIGGHKFGPEFAWWNGSVSQNSTLFSPDYSPFAQNNGSITIVWFYGIYYITAIFEQIGETGSDYVATSLVAHSAVCDYMDCGNDCTKETIMGAMQYIADYVEDK